MTRSGFIFPLAEIACLLLTRIGRRQVCKRYVRFVAAMTLSAKYPFQIILALPAARETSDKMIALSVGKWFAHHRLASDAQSYTELIDTIREWQQSIRSTLYIASGHRNSRLRYLPAISETFRWTIDTVLRGMYRLFSTKEIRNWFS